MVVKVPRLRHRATTTEWSLCKAELVHSAVELYCNSERAAKYSTCGRSGLIAVTVTRWHKARIISRVYTVGSREEHGVVHVGEHSYIVRRLRIPFINVKLDVRWR